MTTTIMKGVWKRIAVLALLACAVSAEDYYKVLGVDRNADEQVCAFV